MSVNYYFKDTQVQKAKKQLEEALAQLNALDMIFIDNAKLAKAESILDEAGSLHIGQYAAGTLLLKRNEKYYRSVSEMKEFYEKNKDRLLIVAEHGVQYTWEEFAEDILSDPPRPGSQFYRDEDGYAWESRDFF